MEEFSVCFADPMIVDMLLFSEWLAGRSEQDAAKKLMNNTANISLSDMPASVLLQEVKEQFVLFQFLQQYLQSPLLLDSPILCSLGQQIKADLLESYYEFDKEVMRELLGKKLTGKLRKDMDDISEKTGISLKSCQRQFDNIKNIIRTHEDVEGGVTDTLTKLFLFSDSLVKKYYPLVFVFISRFETSKKRLHYLSYDDIISCTEAILERWTYNLDVNSSTEKPFDIDEIDRHFLQELRDLRNLATERDFQEAHKSLVINRLEKKATTLHFIKSVESNFKTISRNIFVLGGGLSHTKDFRDFLNDSVEKIVEPLKQSDWVIKEVDVFLTAFTNSWGDFKGCYEVSTRNFDAVFIRYMEIMKKCLLTMYK